jgi:hypothetical protein
MPARAVDETMDEQTPAEDTLLADAFDCKPQQTQIDDARRTLTNDTA